MSNEFLMTRNAYIAQTVAGLGLLAFGAVQLGLDMRSHPRVNPQAPWHFSPFYTAVQDCWPHLPSFLIHG
jgi:hypothetical protein